MASNTLIWEDITIMGRSYRNFDSAPKSWTPRGQKGPCQFAMALTEARVMELEEMGVEINYTKPWPDAPDDWEPTPFVTVHLRYDNYPPEVWKVTKSRRVELTEETVGLLNYAEIVTADLRFRVSHFQGARGEGYKLYAQKLYVTVDEDQMDVKYAHIPVSTG